MGDLDMTLGDKERYKVFELEKEIRTLKAQIERMKNCENCKNFVEYFGCVKVDGTNRIIAQKKQRICRLLRQCKNNDLWEIRI